MSHIRSLLVALLQGQTSSLEKACHSDDLLKYYFKYKSPITTLISRGVAVQAGWFRRGLAAWLGWLGLAGLAWGAVTVRPKSDFPNLGCAFGSCSERTTLPALILAGECKTRSFYFVPLCSHSSLQDLVPHMVSTPWGALCKREDARRTATNYP
jgi:hypothetical protein